jgi:hypothetical protein
MYLDSNGDGVHSSADQVSPSGSTTIDVFLTTNQDRDGSIKTCQDGPLTIFSYQIILQAVNGTVTWGTPVNRMPDFNIASGPFTSVTEFYVGAFTLGTASVPGTYRLMTAVASVASGSPEIRIAPDAPSLSRPYLNTSFGSNCSGIDYDNTIKLNSDWFDVDGLPFGVAGPPNSAPTLTGIQDVTVPVGEHVVQPVSATDPDGQTLQLSKLSGPAYMGFTIGEGDRGSASGRIDLHPIYTDVGATTGAIGVTDGESASSRSFGITVVSAPNHQPALEPIGDITIAVGTVRREPLYSRDADGQALSFSKQAGPEFLSVSTLASGPGATRGLLLLAPSLCDAGEHQAAVGVTDGALTAAAPVRVVVSVPGAIPPPAERRFQVAPGPRDIALGDFNRDGHADIATISGGLSTLGVLSVLLGDGAGNFGSRVDYPAGSGSESHRITSDDWNQDGATDLVVIGDDRMRLYFGRGDGTFEVGPIFDTGLFPSDVRSADLNGDGLQDIVVANGFNSFLSIYLGAGAGSFAPRQDVRSPSSAYGVAVSDLNGDGRLDLASGSFLGRAVVVHLGHGDGAFANGVEISVPAGVPFDIEAADFNSDGKIDLVVPLYERGVVILTGNGDGTFLTGPLYPGFATSPNASVADLNGDGHLDLAIAGPELSGVRVMYGRGDGSFGDPVTVAPTAPADRVTLGDVNEDGLTDILIPNAATVVLNTSGAGAAVEARAFPKNPERTHPNVGGGGSMCVRVEPVDGSYENADMDLSSLTLRSSGTGSVDRITAQPAKGVVEGDVDRNGVAELEACFAQADLARLFDQVSGRRTVHASLEGALTNGKRFCAGFDMKVLGIEGSLAATVSPNPLNPQGVLTFRTAVSGFLRVRMFDLGGRLVRTLADVPLAPAGPQEVRIDGRGARGETLASGVYFWVVDTPAGQMRGRLTILK